MVIPKVKIINVDMDGFTGRNFHPDKSDIGKTAVIVKTEAYFVDPDSNFEEEILSPDGRVFAGFMDAKDYDNVYWIFTCITDEDNKVLELMHYEVAYDETSLEHYKKWAD
jgi:hypothetical protein